MSSSDEPDYMSEEFLVTCEKNDMRPGLIHNRSEQRKHCILKMKVQTDSENKRRYRPYRVIEKERREEGLKMAIGSDNKGFAMLQKMGYQPGTAIGKSGAGCVEPINIEVKADRGGLGRKEALQMVEAEKMAIRKKMASRRNEVLNVEDYQMRLSRERAEKQIVADLRRSQRICLQLDTDKGYDEPAEPWFWPEGSQTCQEERLQESDADDEDGDEAPSVSDTEDAKISDSDEFTEEIIEFKPSDKLEILTLYLRKTYFYCVWCGTKYNDSSDLESTCPGPSGADH
ncbi:G patch domain-containing protein 11 isoform X1 [Anabrus simplex]|uniref:G patch domain-containing protein 11 isoform X1 n=1 Tax=Anabrus simplex TaxID=316456 RepID=UPI0034DDAC47